MNKLLYTLALAALACPAGLHARTLGVDEAKANATSFLNGGKFKAPGAPKALKLAHVINDNAGVPALYLFTGNDGNGLVVASASSLTPAVLGYTDTGKLDPGAMPPSLAALLQDYSNEIAQAEAGQVMRVAAKAAVREPVAPLCKTQWNQNAPYNDLVPEMNGQHCMTGCVATAMAQVMKTFEWPAERGEGFVSYKWVAGNKQLSYDLSKSTLDWASMLNNYDNDATAEQGNAVATLMRDCGYATNMQYSLSASGTTAITIPPAFYYNFGYDKGVRTIQRYYYTLSDWEEIVYNEIKNGRPVIFTGVSNAQGGHCFVCDGYSSDRYYHINWGWGGMSDGYFLLSALNPETQGIGGSTGGFNNYINACIGIQKPVEGSELYTAILGDGNFGTAEPSYASNSKVIFSAEAFYNPGMEKFTTTMGVKATDSKGQSTYLSAANTISLESYGMVTRYAIEASQFPGEGTYTVTPVWYNQETAQWEDVMFPVDKIHSVALTIADGMLNFTPIAVDADLTAQNVKLLTDIYTNANFHISADLTNNGDTEYLGELHIALIDNNQKTVATTDPFNVDIEAGQTLPVDMISRFTTTPDAGDYRLCFATTDGKIISEPIKVSLSSISGLTSILLENLRVTSGDNASIPTVPSNDVSVAGTLRCNSGYFDSTLTAYIFPQRGGNSLGTIGAGTFFLHPGETSDFEMHGSFGNGVIGTIYMVGFFHGQDQVPGTLYFQLGEASGITAIETPDGISMHIDGTILNVTGTAEAVIHVYCADGSHVLAVEGVQADMSALAPGAYIAVAYTPHGPAMIKFMR